jgi:hypothetical protein
MHARYPLLLIVLAVALIAGCDSDGLSEDDPVQTARAVYIANQGNFGDANGSVSVYDPEAGTVSQAALTSFNSILQSLALDDGRLYVAANTGGRVDVFATSGLTQSAQLTGLTGPRYIAVRGDKAFVTDQPPFGSTRPSQVRVIDPSVAAPNVADSIAVSGTVDGIAVAGDRVYAALGAFGSSTRVAAINAAQNTLAEEINVGCAARYLTADRQNEVFVLCTDAAEAVVLDGATGTERARIALPDTAETLFSIGQPAYYAAPAQELYVTTDSGIIRLDTEANVVTAVLDAPTDPAPTAIAYDAGRESLYLGRTPAPPAGFTQRGSVTVHNRQGTPVDTFEVGVAPAYIDLQPPATP